MFRTAKYRPEIPTKGFADLQQTRGWAGTGSCSPPGITKQLTGIQRAGAGPRSLGTSGGSDAQPKERDCDCNGDRGGVDGSGSRVTEATTTLAFTACRPAAGTTRGFLRIYSECSQETTTKAAPTLATLLVTDGKDPSLSFDINHCISIGGNLPFPAPRSNQAKQHYRGHRPRQASWKRVPQPFHCIGEIADSNNQKSGQRQPNTEQVSANPTRIGEP